jgi:hypothetical protein
VIDGLRFDMSSDELRDYLSQRVAHHEEREQFYAKQLQALKDGAQGEEMPHYTGGNPIDGLTTKTQEHRNKARMFAFMRDHVTPNEQYRLNETDLAKIEILGRYL